MELILRAEVLRIDAVHNDEEMLVAYTYELEKIDLP